MEKPTEIKPYADLKPLPRTFYVRPTLTVARELLGKYLVRRFQGEPLVGKIVETEAYIGQEDPASHAARGKTSRTSLMFGPPGFAYIYFVYGMYFCLNAVTEAEGFPAAVLIRAVEPLAGISRMQVFRPGASNRLPRLTNGPGKLCQAYAIDKRLNGTDLCGKILFIAPGIEVAESSIAVDTRIGIRVGKEYPWRFYIKGNPFVSQAD